METLIQDKQVAVINNSIEIFKTAPEILKANQERSQKALAVGSGILQAWIDAWRMEDEEQKIEALAAVDTRSNNYLANCNKALKEEKETRAAITQMMDEFKKMFTASENDIDRTKAGTIPAQVQFNRDNYAKEVFEIQERKRKEAERVAAKAKEAIEIRNNIELHLINSFNGWLLEKKTKMQNFFNAITLDNFSEAEEKLKNAVISITWKPDEQYITGVYHTTQEISEFSIEVCGTIMDGFKSTTEAEISLIRDELIDKLPSKKTELLEQNRLAEEAEAARVAAEKATSEAKSKAEKEAAERARVVAEEARLAQEKASSDQKKREEEESARIAADAEEARKKAEQEAEIRKQGEQTMVMFEQEAAIAETQAPESRQGYEIIVTHQAGFVQLFQLWFENEGKALPIDKIGNTKLDQMKAWAEKHAHKTGTKIESKFLNYKESFTAVNRKVK